MPKMIPKELDWDLTSEEKIMNFDLKYLTMKEQG